MFQYDNAPQQEDDPLYAGFATSAFSQMSNPLSRNPLSVLHSQQPPPSQGGMFWGTGAPGTGNFFAPGTSSGMGGENGRPMTSNRGVGYTQSQFDPLKQGAKMGGPAPPLQKKTDDSPEEQCLEMERKVNALVEESAQLALQGEFTMALEKAKEASKKERMLCKQRETQGLADQVNIDLTYSVHFNLAVQYHHNQLYTEALNTYSLIVRNKQYAMSGRLRVNMGNIYMEQGKNTLGIKMYRMALEQIPSTAKELRYKVMRNIGNAFVKYGQYHDAIQSYDAIIEGSPDIVTGFNLLLCLYALGDKDRLKRLFTKLLNIRKYGAADDDDDLMLDELDDDRHDTAVPIDDDGLKAEIRERRKQHMQYLLTGARLIAPMIDRDWQTGYDYIIEQLRHYEINDTNSRLVAEMEMCKALQFMKHKKYSKAIEALKAFEKKEKILRAKAATNLAYLYFLEGDMENGEKYASMAVDSDRYNAKALTNKGNFHFMKKEYDKAKDIYSEAINVEADCIEALYNKGLVCKALDRNEEALIIFKKLQTMLPDSVEVIYQIADLYDQLGDTHNSGKWFEQLIARVSTDPNALARLGTICDKEEDVPQAFHYHLEAYRYFPVNMDVISWLGAYFVRQGIYEKAMQYFERASQIQPNEVKWQLMVASCHRRIGAYPQAKRLYEEIHKKYPDNVECLRYLVHICNDSGMKDEAVEYHKKLKKMESRLQDGDAFQLVPIQQDQPEEEEEEAVQLPQRRGMSNGSMQMTTSEARKAKEMEEMQQLNRKIAAEKKAEEEADIGDHMDEMLPMGS